jgi:hypothetical protein
MISFVGVRKDQVWFIGINILCYYPFAEISCPILKLIL